MKNVFSKLAELYKILSKSSCKRKFKLLTLKKKKWKILPNHKNLLALTPDGRKCKRHISLLFTQIDCDDVLIIILNLAVIKTPIAREGSRYVLEGLCPSQARPFEERRLYYLTCHFTKSHVSLKVSIRKEEKSVNL